MKKPKVYFQLRWILAGVFLFALALRLIFVVQWFGTPYGYAPFIDAQAYNNWAKEIAAGHIYRGAAFYLSPLFPYLLALLYTIFGTSLWIGPLFNAFLGAGTCTLLSRVTYRAFGPVAAISAGVLTAVYRPFLFYTGPVMKEALVLFLMALFVSFAYDAVKSNRLRDFIWSGVALGICAIGRGNLLAFIPILLGFIYLHKNSARWRNAGGFLLGVAIAILPITLHNAIASSDFVLLSYSDGFNLYMGHNSAASGISYVFPRDVMSSPLMEEYTTTQMASEAVGHPLKPSGVSAYWRGLAVDYALAHPGREFEMLLSKIRAFWSNDEPYDNYDMVFIAEHFDTLLSGPLPGFAVVVFLALFGGLASTRKRGEETAFFAALAFVYMATLFPFYVTERYRLPVAVFLLPLAGAAIPAAIELVRKKKFTRLAVLAAPALAAFAFAFVPAGPDSDAHDDCYSWVRLVTCYEDEGYHVAALEALNQALIIDPHRVWSDAWIKAADAKINLGQRAEGEQLIEKARKQFGNDGSIDYNYGRMKLDDNDYPAAFAAFQKAIEKTPTFTPSYRGLAVVYDHLGNRDAALAAVHQGLAIVPNDLNLKEILGQLQSEP